MSEINAVLVGNPNSGKTTLFNALTGAKHHVGNWPGVTVEKKEGKINYKENKINLVDLPGIYSIFPFSIEEKVSRKYILENDIDVIINIVNAANLERNLYLTLQLLELGKPVILALNMMDTVEKKGIHLDIDELKDKLGVQAIPIVANKDVGSENLLDSVVNYKENNFKLNYGKKIESLIGKNKFNYKNYDSRWLSIKLLENDKVIQEKTNKESYTDLTNEITKKKYQYIDGILKSVIKQKPLNYKGMTSFIDKIVTNQYLGIPIFLLIIGLVFNLTFSIGNQFVDLLDMFFNQTLASKLSIILKSLDVSPWLQSLVVDGILGGVGGVLVFLPNIIILFFFISILEDSGYMARVALITNKWMRKIGLNGKTFIPMIMGFGCNVPAIMSTRSLKNEKDRLIAILINPFMSCGARLPVYILFTSIFFKKYQGIVTFSLYLLGILVAILVAFIFKNTIFKGEKSPFIIELPDYHMPRVKSLGIHLWQKVKGYIINAGTVIFIASVFLWFILNYNFSGEAELINSFGAYIGKAVTPVFKPLGFGEWRSVLALITGVIAKEVVVANMNILFDGDLAQTLPIYFNSLSAYSYMVFVLLYIPCVATIGVIKRETNSYKWTFFSLIYQLIVAWSFSFMIYQIGSLILG